MNITEQLQSNLKRYRELSGINASELARRSGVSRAHIYQIEHGESAPTIEIIQQLAMGLGITLETLLGLDGKVPTLHLEERQHQWMLQHQDADATEADQDGMTIRAIYLSPMYKAKLAKQEYQFPVKPSDTVEQQKTQPDIGTVLDYLAQASQRDFCDIALAPKKDREERHEP